MLNAARGLRGRGAASPLVGPNQSPDRAVKRCQEMREVCFVIYMYIDYIFIIDQIFVVLYLSIPLYLSTPLVLLIFES